MIEQLRLSIGSISTGTRFYKFVRYLSSPISVPISNDFQVSKAARNPSKRNQKILTFEKSQVSKYFFFLSGFLPFPFKTGLRFSIFAIFPRESAFLVRRGHPREGVHR